MSVKRPISPHLTIYKPQITSVLSITHRMTGVVLFLGVVLSSWWLIMNAYGCGKCLNPLLDTFLAKLILTAFIAALFYHLCNGIRHLFWDMGYGFTIRSVNISGVVVICAAAALTALTWYVM